MANIGKDLLFDMAPLSASRHEKRNYNAPFEENSSLHYGINTSFLPFNPLFPNSFDAKTSETHLISKSIVSNSPTVSLDSLSNKNLLAGSTVPKKRTRSKSGSSNKKKSKTKHKQIPEEEKNLDKDLLALVGSLEQDQKLDSDSSRDTIIIDDINSSENFLNLPTESSLICEKKNNILANSVSQNSSNTSLLKQALSKDFVPASGTFNVSNNLGDFATINTNTVFQKKDGKKPRKVQQKSFMYNSQLASIKKMTSESHKNGSSTSKVTGKLPGKNCQLIYASMGLDEDLCDVKTSMIEEKQDLGISLSASKVPFLNFNAIPIKLERDAPVSLGIGQSKNSRGLHETIQNLSSSDMHVSMTFEADPFDEEDDLPLSFLKDKISVDEISSEEKSMCTANRNTTWDHMPTFIKQELIEEDEVLSVTNCNLVNSKDCRNKVLAGKSIFTSGSSSNVDLISVKVKAEPSTEADYYSSSTKMACSETVLQPPSDIYVSTISETVKKKSKNQKKDQNKNSIGNGAKISDASNSVVVSDYALPDTHLTGDNLSTNYVVNDMGFSGMSSKFSENNIKNVTENQISKVNLFNLDDPSSCLNYEQYQVKFAKNSSNSFNNLENLAKESIEINITSNKSIVKKKGVKKAGKLSKKRTNMDVYCKNVEKSEVSQQTSIIPETGLIVETLKIPDANFVTKCNISENKTASKKKGKKKKDPKKKSVDFDENLPITLLIKRQKSDVNVQSSDSFLCTNVSKTAVAESKKHETLNKLFQDNLNNSVSNANLSSVFLPLNSEENLELTKDEESVEMASLSFQSSDSKQNYVKTKRTAPKKKRTQKKKNASGRNKTKEISNKPNDNEPLNSLQANVYIPKTYESSCDKNNSNLVEKETPEKRKEKNANTLVYMSFEEQHSPTEEEEYLNTILSIKKETDDHLNTASAVQPLHDLRTVPSVIKSIKKESDFVKDSESKAFEQSDSMPNNEQNDSPPSTQTSLISEISSELSSSTSNLNFKDVGSQHMINDSDQISLKSNKSSSPSKKKKRTRRSNNWYKKKKSRAKVKNTTTLVPNNILPVLETNTSFADTDSVTSVSEINTDILTVSQMPVVFVKDLHLNIEKPAANNLEEKLQSSLQTVQDTVPLPVKRKNKNKAGSTPKRKKLSTLDEPQNKESLLETTECGAIDNFLNKSENTVNLKMNLSIISEKNICLSPVSTTTESTLYKSASEENLNASCNDLSYDKNNEIITIEDSPIKSSLSNCTRKKLLSPTLSIATIQQDIDKLVECFADKGVLKNSPSEVIEKKQTDLSVPLSPIGSISKSTVSSTSYNLSNFSTDRINSFINKSSALTFSTLEIASTKPCNKINFHATPAEVKKENGNNSQSLSSLRNSHDIVYENKSIFDRTQNISNSFFPRNLTSIKKEVPTDNIHYNFQNSLFSFNRSGSISSQIAYKAQINTDNSHTSEPQILKSVECSQKKTADFNDETAFSIKKEVFKSTKFGSSKNISSNVRSLDDVIKRSVEMHKPLASTSNVLSNLNSKTSSPSLLLLPGQSPTAVQSTSRENMFDDEIQVLEIGPKDVPCVDLTDENSPTLISEVQENLPPINSKIENIQNNNKSNQLTSNITDTSSKDSIINEDNQMESNRQNSEPSTSDEETVRSQLNHESNDFLFHIMDENVPPSAEGEIIDPLVVREKYVNEYFKYPFPPSAIFHFKPRNKNKIYSRINLQPLNLSIEKVELRLKNSDNIKYQFGNKLGDIVKLEKYPVNSSEVECYHRILGVAPSHKLLSKCFKSPDIKASMILSKEFNLFDAPDAAIESKLPNSMNCSLHDIIQGITEYRMMSSDSSLQTSEVFDRDCPSTDTRDSFESHISNVSEINLSQKKELNINTVTKENEQVNLHQDANSSGRNSVLSCTASDFQDSTKNDSADVDFSSLKNLVEPISNGLDISETSSSNNIFNYLSLPSKEVLDNIVNMNSAGKSISAVETSDQCMKDTYSELGKEPLSDLLPNADEQVMSASSSSVVNSCVNSNTNDNFDVLQNAANSVINLDVPVLRKILEVAGGLLPSTTNNESYVWKSKETFDYNHTQCTPVVDMNSEHNMENIDNHSSNNVASEDRANIMTCQDDSKHGNSDDDYVDNEPVHYESDADRCEADADRSDLKEKDDDKETEIPQYKSRWEKIMERKNLENKQKEKVNEHLLKDCFPVPTKKLNVFEKTSIKTAQEKPKALGKKECTTIKDKTSLKLQDKKGKKIELKPKKKDKKKTKNDNKNDAKLVDSKKATKLKLKSKKAKDKIKLHTSSLFAPDKPVKKTDGKRVTESCDKADDGNQSKRFYGNRVTNRGTFLTESSSDFLTSIKIPKKKKAEVNKKPLSARSEEFHSMIKSPDINIESGFFSPYKIVSKSNIYSSFKKNEFYKRELPTNAHPSTSAHLPFIKDKLQNKRVNVSEPHSTDFHSYQDNMQKRNSPLLKTPTSSSLLPSRECMPNTNATLLNAPSILFQPKNNSLPRRAFPLLSNTPSNSFECLSTSTFSSEIALLKSIMSSVKLNDSTMATKDMLPLSEHSNSAWNNNQTNFCTQPNSTKDYLSSSTYATDLPSTSYNFLNSVLRPSSFNFPLQNQPDLSFDSQGLNTFVKPNKSNQILPQTPKKASSTCLVPQHLKTLVGHETIETLNVRLLMLEWSVDWLVQQQKFHDPPPISNSLKKVVSSYDNFEDHYNTYFPLMLLDTWHRIYVSWTHLSQHTPHFCNIISYSVKNTFVSVECQTIFNSTIHPKGVFPDEGSILMIKYGTKPKDYNIKILGYVTSVKTRRFNPITDSKFGNFKPPKDGNYEVFQVLTLSYMGAYNSEDIDKQLPVRIHVLCNVKSTLKQNDALLYINKSPLLRSILNPVEDGLLCFGLTPRNSPQDKINECVRDITKGILSPHPLPLLTIVKAAPQSDRLNIIPLLIEKMKNVYKTKVLLCVRTVRALGDIAANICLHESLKLVIVNKRGDTSPQFQKYLLDELVTSERNSAEETPENLHSKNEAIIRTKKQIFKECDVVLCLIRNCHDEFMEATFTETESVAQMCCIVDEANLCTEPETLIPILHGISKLILIGDPDYPAKVLSKTARSFDYTRSFFHRAHDLDLITE